MQYGPDPPEPHHEAHQQGRPERRVGEQPVKPFVELVGGSWPYGRTHGASQGGWVRRPRAGRELVAASSCQPTVT